ncbi:hypothetical protein JS562_21590 [Agrobacterium sp. S2]|nr:hypothetical protein [Agrobacterium sp. S2]
MATVVQIDGQLEALSAHVSECEAKARELAFQAVSGDKDAAAELARMNSEIKRATDDKLVLEQARVTALKREAEAAAANDAESRARHMGDARMSAGKLVDLAGRVDKLIAEFFALSAEIDGVERELWRSLVAAKHTAPAQPTGATACRKSRSNAWILKFVVCACRTSEAWARSQPPLGVSFSNLKLIKARPRNG